MPPPLTPEPNYQQSPDNYYAPAGAPPPQFPPKKKSNGALIALIAILALALLGAGAWAIYNYLIKPKIKKNTVEYNEVESDNNSFSTEPDDDNSIVLVDSISTDTVAPEDEDNEIPSIPEATTPKNKNVQEQNGEPWGMTDEEAAQMRRNRRGNVPSVPRAQRQNPRNGDPWGMTDEEAAQMRRNRRGNVPSVPRAQRQNPRNGDPWGMTDEEARQMQYPNNEDPWGMTDEEAQQMQRNRRGNVPSIPRQR